MTWLTPQERLSPYDLMKSVRLIPYNLKVHKTMFLQTDQVHKIMSARLYELDLISK